MQVTLLWIYILRQIYSYHFEHPDSTRRVISNQNLEWLTKLHTQSRQHNAFQTVYVVGWLTTDNLWKRLSTEVAIWKPLNCVAWTCTPKEKTAVGVASCHTREPVVSYPVCDYYILQSFLLPCMWHLCSFFDSNRELHKAKLMEHESRDGFDVTK